jgi:hypothetical protein
MGHPDHDSIVEHLAPKLDSAARSSPKMRLAKDRLFFKSSLDASVGDYERVSVYSKQSV